MEKLNDPLHVQSRSNVAIPPLIHQSLAHRAHFQSSRIDRHKHCVRKITDGLPIDPAIRPEFSMCGLAKNDLSSCVNQACDVAINL